MNTNIKERMFKLLEDKHLTPAEFAQKVGVSRSYAHNVYKTISAEVLLRIKETFPDLSIEWLLIGSGDMYAGAAERKRQADKDAEVEQLKTNVEQLKQKISLLEEVLSLYRERESARKKDVFTTPTAKM